MPKLFISFLKITILVVKRLTDIYKGAFVFLTGFFALCFRVFLDNIFRPQ